MKKVIACSVLCQVYLLAAGPDYTPEKQLHFPERYREWIFLSSGLGMTYAAPQNGADANRPRRFDNVFVNPESYRSFVETGRWPDKTVFVLEIRDAESHVSINQGGHTQGGVTAIEVEVKDASAKPGEWTFYAFPGGPGTTAKPIGRDASCYGCHGKNAAVENTFVQFYPTLLEIARKKGTLTKLSGDSSFGSPHRP